MNFPQNSSKQQKGIVWQYVANVLGKFIENFFFRHKSDDLRNEDLNTQKVSFSYHV